MSLRLPFVLALLAGCGSLPPVEPCGEIPERGCPIGRGGSCDDVACAALYDCVSGEWTEEVTCEKETTASSSSAGAGGGGGCEPIAIDRTGETDGCEPDLQEPDCPAAAAETCPEPCRTGCADFFLCVEGGWIDVAACDQDGELIVLPR